MITHQPYLWVNCEGKRFFNEGISGSGIYTANALSRQKNKCAYLIFDANTKRHLEENFGDYFKPPDINSISNIDDLVKRYRDRGNNEVFMANSIEGIGNSIGINHEIIQNTVDEYNRCCDKGHDDLFAKNPRYLQPLKCPPYYAFKIILIAYGTVGGIRINEKAEVIDKNGDIIPGLYAAGDCANGALSYNFWIAFGLRGNPSSFALNTGRMAAENALRYLGK